MSKKRLVQLSICSLICGVVGCVVSFFFYHFVSAEGLQWQKEAAKPFVAEMLGDLSVLFVFAGLFCLLVSWIIYGKDDETK
jgi:amino acid transporter